MTFPPFLSRKTRWKFFFQAIDAERKGENDVFGKSTQNDRAKMTFLVNSRGEEGQKKIFSSNRRREEERK